MHLVVSGKVGVRTWGTTVTTPAVREDFAKVKVRTELEYPDGTDCKDIRLKTVLRAPGGQKVAERETALSPYDEGVLEQDFVVDRPCCGIANIRTSTGRTRRCTIRDV